MKDNPRNPGSKIYSPFEEKQLLMKAKRILSSLMMSVPVFKQVWWLCLHPGISGHEVFMADTSSPKGTP